MTRRVLRKTARTEPHMHQSEIRPLSHAVLCCSLSVIPSSSQQLSPPGLRVSVRSLSLSPQKAKQCRIYIILAVIKKKKNTRVVPIDDLEG